MPHIKGRNARQPVNITGDLDRDLGDGNVIILRGSPPSTRQPIVRQIRELIDDNPRSAPFMAYFIAKAIEACAEDVITDPTEWPGGEALYRPLMVSCAKRILAKRGWHEFPVTICPNRK